MSAEGLRRAAALMRERAEACVDGWDQQHTPESWRETYWVGGDYDQDAPHIAAWHPAVALAVADWLERESQKHGHDPLGVEVGPIYDLPGMANAPALAVARAYLGESA